MLSSTIKYMSYVPLGRHSKFIVVYDEEQHSLLPDSNGVLLLSHISYSIFMFEELYMYILHSSFDMHTSNGMLAGALLALFPFFSVISLS